MCRALLLSQGSRVWEHRQGLGCPSELKGSRGHAERRHRRSLQRVGEERMGTGMEKGDKELGVPPCEKLEVL